MSHTVYQLKQKDNDTLLMEVTASSVERAQDYFYEQIPESYSPNFIVTPKPRS
jgi:hypothetical protein